MDSLSTVTQVLQNQNARAGRVGVFPEFDSDGFRLEELQNLDETREGLRKAALAFESVFVSMLLKEMRRTVHSDDGILPRSPEREFYEEMLDDKIALNLSQRGALGLADRIVDGYGGKLAENEARSVRMDRVA
jgi:flagellar protein FlgJ